MGCCHHLPGVTLHKSVRHSSPLPMAHFCSCLPQGLRVWCSIESAFPPDLLAHHPSGLAVDVILLTIMSLSARLQSPCPSNSVLISVPYCLHSTSHCFVSFFVVSPQNEVRNRVCLFTLICCLSRYLDVTGIKSVFAKGRIIIADVTLSSLPHFD